MDEDFDEPIDDIDDLEDLEDIEEDIKEETEEEEDDEEDVDEEEVDEDEDIKKEEIDEEIDEEVVEGVDIVDNLSKYNIEDETKRKIANKNRTTRNFLSKFEYPMILGVRATQIAKGAKPLMDVPENIKKPVDIARYELENKKIPFIIRRTLPNNKYEEWKLNELIIPEFIIKKSLLP